MVRFHRRVQGRQIAGEEYSAEHEQREIARLGRDRDRTKTPARTAMPRNARRGAALAGTCASHAEPGREPPHRERGQRPGHAVECGRGLGHVAQPHEYRVGRRRNRSQHHTGRRERREGSRPRRGVARHRHFTIPFTRRMGVLRNRMGISRQENAPTIRGVSPSRARDRLPGPPGKPIAEDIRPARKPWPRTGGQFGFEDLGCDR